MATEDQVTEPQVEEAAAEPEVTEKAAAPKKAAPKKAAAPEFVYYESREKEPTQFEVAGYRPSRNFSTGRLEFKVRGDDVARFEQNHFVKNSRIVKKV